MERPENAGLATEVFDQFCSAGTLKSILNHHRHLCDLLHIRPTHINQFYPKLKAKLRSWKAQALWNKFDKRASHKCYNRGKACTNLRVLVIGAGPCGLRTAIEAQLLGAKVVVVEKRDRITRNNVLHLWPFVIHDLKALGAKKFFGRFCAGAIDHISIRQLQCILLKVALILGVEIHEGVGFESLIPPPDDQADERVGWRARTSPPDHPVSQYEFDALIGADGKRNTLDGFKRKEFRGKLAIAITANFINRHSEAEARVEEISGVAFIFNQKFFKELYASTGIDLENIVYYKDDTHYFVMTAKKHSLIDKGVIISDYSDTAKLLSPDNVDKTALMEYAREAADFSTGCRLPQLEFAVNHYGQPDVAMFDFTSMYAAENASRFIEKRGHRLMTALVGDSLLEPFWPTGSGCARGFLSSMDSCWALRSWGSGSHPLEVMAERESIYRLLGQTTPENLHRDLQAYTLDPCTRYPNLNSRSVLPVQVKNLLVTDDPSEVEQFLKAPRNVATQNNDVPKKRKRRETAVGAETLLHWLQRQVALVDDVTIENVTSSFKDGLALCAIISRYRPHLLDFASLDKQEVAKNNQLAFDILEKDCAIPPVMTGDEMAEIDVPDKLAMLSYLSQVYEAFRGEIPHIKHPKIEETEEGKDEAVKAQLTRIRTLAQSGHLSPHHKLNLLGKLTNRERPTRRKRSHLNSGAPIQGSIEDRLKRLEEMADDNKKDFYSDKEFYNRELLESGDRPRVSQYSERIKELERERRERARRREEIEKNRMDRYMRRKYLRHIANQQFYKSLSMLQSNARDDEDKQPIEDFSLFVYRMTAPDFKDRVKDLENKLLHPERANRPSLDGKGGNGEDVSGRVKDLEAKFRGTHADKKPKDLLRAIGKIEKTDWNVKQIEQKIEENRMGRGTSRKSEKVPKWSKEQFEDKFSAVERKLRARSNRADDNKYNHIDSTMKSIEKKVKEGFSLEQGKVSAMAEHLAKIHRQPEPVVQPTGKQPPLMPSQGASELCHFCDKRVYLMERLSAEGRFFHRGCFRCQYCSTSLRLGNYAFDREGKYGFKFYCVQHFGLAGTQSSRRTREDVKPRVTTVPKTPTAVPALQPPEMVDIGSTPERVEFENLSCAEVEVEEDEFTDRNFGLSTTDVSDASQGSDSSSDSDGFAEAEDGGLDPEETLRLVKDWTRRYAPSYSSSDDSETEMEDEDDDDDVQKKKPTGTDSGSDTESAACSTRRRTRQRGLCRDDRIRDEDMQHTSYKAGKSSSPRTVCSFDKFKPNSKRKDQFLKIGSVQKSKSVPSTSTMAGDVRDQKSVVKTVGKGKNLNHHKTEKKRHVEDAGKSSPCEAKPGFIEGSLKMSKNQENLAPSRQLVHSQSTSGSKELWKDKDVCRSKSSPNASGNSKISDGSDVKLPRPVAMASQVVHKTIFSVVQPLQTAVDFISKIAEKAVCSVTPSLQKADYSFVTPIHGPPRQKTPKCDLDRFSSALPEISTNEIDIDDAKEVGLPSNRKETPDLSTEQATCGINESSTNKISERISPKKMDLKSVDKMEKFNNKKIESDSRLTGLLEKVNAIRAGATSAIKQLEKEKPKIQEAVLEQYELKSPKLVNESSRHGFSEHSEQTSRNLISVFEKLSAIEKSKIPDDDPKLPAGENSFGANFGTKRPQDHLSESVLSLISYETGKKALLDQDKPFSKYSFRTRSVSSIPDRPLVISTSGAEDLSLPEKYVPYRLRKLTGVEDTVLEAVGSDVKDSNLSGVNFGLNDPLKSSDSSSSRQSKYGQISESPNIRIPPSQSKQILDSYHKSIGGSVTHAKNDPASDDLPKLITGNVAMPERFPDSLSKLPKPETPEIQSSSSVHNADVSMEINEIYRRYSVSSVYRERDDETENPCDPYESKELETALNIRQTDRQKLDGDLPASSAKPTLPATKLNDLAESLSEMKHSREAFFVHLSAEPVGSKNSSKVMHDLPESKTPSRHECSRVPVVSAGKSVEVENSTKISVNVEEIVSKPQNQNQKQKTEPTALVSVRENNDLTPDESKCKIPIKFQPVKNFESDSKTEPLPECVLGSLGHKTSTVSVDVPMKTLERVLGPKNETHDSRSSPGPEIKSVASASRSNPLESDAKNIGSAQNLRAPPVPPQEVSASRSTDSTKPLVVTVPKSAIVRSNMNLPLSKPSNSVNSSPVKRDELDLNKMGVEKRIISLHDTAPGQKSLPEGEPAQNVLNFDLKKPANANGGNRSTLNESARTSKDSNLAILESLPSKLKDTELDKPQSPQGSDGAKTSSSDAPAIEKNSQLNFGSDSPHIVKIPKQAVFRQSKIAMSSGQTGKELSLNRPSLTHGEPNMQNHSKKAQSSTEVSSYPGKDPGNPTVGIPFAATHNFDAGSSVSVKIPKAATGKSPPKNSSGYPNPDEPLGIQLKTQYISTADNKTGLSNTASDLSPNEDKKPLDYVITNTLDSNAAVVVKIPKEAIFRRDSVVGKAVNESSNHTVGDKLFISSSNALKAISSARSVPVEKPTFSRPLALVDGMDKPKDHIQKGSSCGAIEEKKSFAKSDTGDSAVTYSLDSNASVVVKIPREAIRRDSVAANVLPPAPAQKSTSVNVSPSGRAGGPLASNLPNRPHTNPDPSDGQPRYPNCPFDPKQVPAIQNSNRDQASAEPYAKSDQGDCAVTYSLDSNASVTVKIPREAIRRDSVASNVTPLAPAQKPPSTDLTPSSRAGEPLASNPPVGLRTNSNPSIHPHSPNPNQTSAKDLKPDQYSRGPSVANSDQGDCAVTYSLDSNASVIVKIPRGAIRRDYVASNATPLAPAQKPPSTDLTPSSRAGGPVASNPPVGLRTISNPSIHTHSPNPNQTPAKNLKPDQYSGGPSVANSDQGDCTATYSLDSNASVTVKIPREAIRRDSVASNVTPLAPAQKPPSTDLTRSSQAGEPLASNPPVGLRTNSNPSIHPHSPNPNQTPAKDLKPDQYSGGPSVANSDQGDCAVTYSLDSNASVIVKIPRGAIRRDSVAASPAPVAQSPPSRTRESLAPNISVGFGVGPNLSVVGTNTTNPSGTPKESPDGNTNPDQLPARPSQGMLPPKLHQEPPTAPNPHFDKPPTTSSDDIALPNISSAVKVSVQEENPYVTTLPAHVPSEFFEVASIESALESPHLCMVSSTAQTKTSYIQSDDYSGDESSEEENSATEISTDSEFEHDGTTHTIPDIVISETVQVKRGHLEQPKQVQIVSRQLNGKYETNRAHNNDLKLELNRIEPKPAVNNILNNNRPKPLINPNRGDYLLNRTQSTEGIASKISLELKKKYLLGPQGLSGNVKKSGSTSTLDTKFKSLIDQISEQQKLLHPAPVPSPTMQAFLQGADKLKMSPIQLLDKKTLPTEGFKHVCALKEKEDVKEDKKDKEKEEEEGRPRSPVHETSIVVPEFPRTEQKEVDSDSLSSDLSSSEDEEEEEEENEEEDDGGDKIEEPQLQSPPKLEIHNSRGELMEDAPELDSLNMPDICQAENEKSPIDKLDLVPMEFKKGIAVPADSAGSVVLTQVSNPAELYVKEDLRAETPDSSDSLKNDVTVHTETEMSDWARDEDGVSEPLDDLEFIGQYGSRKSSGPRGIAKTAAPEDFDEYTHVCGKESADPLNLDNLEFMDTGDESSEGSSARNQLHLNRGYVQFVNNDEDLTPVAEIVNPLKEELTDTTTTSEPTTVKDSPADGLQNIELELSSLPGKVRYGTVRESIEVMKRNQKEALIEPKGNALNSPATTRKLEQLSQERAKQKDLIHEMVMNKLIAQGKSPTERAERKTKRLSRNFSPSNHNTPPAEPKVEESPKPSAEPPENNENRDILNKLTPRHRSYTVGSGWGTEQHNRDAISLPDIHTACEFKTPLATPNLRSGLREQARAKFKMMSDEELGLSPEDRLKRYKIKIQKQLQGETPKSSRVGDRVDSSRKSKEDRKKSIIQAVSDFFYKKSPSPPKTPSSHSPTKNLTITFPRKDKQSDAPPVPPPPQAYTPSQEDSLSEEETHSGDNTSLLKKQRVSQRIARQAQSKRLRMAQEVQRQLEELEIKQKELEAQGVAVEKALRGEDIGEGRNETELLAEWLRLTRERSEARSKEKTLVIRGQEIELEHRHARLQAQLSDIMSSSPDGRKSSEEVALEGRILREMLEIVERKNSLQAQLQAETQRFEEEDKDLEAQMLAKGLQLPPKSPAPI